MLCMFLLMKRITIYVQGNYLRLLLLLLHRQTLEEYVFLKDMLMYLFGCTRQSNVVC